MELLRLFGGRRRRKFAGLPGKKTPLTLFFAPHRQITFPRDLAPRAVDPDVLALACDMGVILVTEDAGFGRLVFQRRLKPPVGVILLALEPMPRVERPAYLAMRAPEALAQAVGSFVTIGPRRIRARRFPDDSPS